MNKFCPPNSQRLCSAKKRASAAPTGSSRGDDGEINTVAEQAEREYSAPERFARPIAAPGAGYLFIKHTFDIVASLLAGVVLLVPMLIIALLIRLDSPGPALFRQERLGKDGRQEPLSAGGTAEEIAQIMLEAGCVGALFARLDAMKIAKGRYFMFLDADDAYLPDALHEVRTGILSYTKRNH